MWTVLLVAALVALILFINREKLPKRQQSFASPGTVARIRGDGRYSVEVVGESFYKAALFNLFGRATDEEGDEREVEAMLRLDDNNPHDSKAVAVFIRGQKVGHLSREMAADFRHSIQRDGLAAWSEFQVAATVYVPHDPDDHYSVSLDLPEA